MFSYGQVFMTEIYLRLVNFKYEALKKNFLPQHKQILDWKWKGSNQSQCSNKVVEEGFWNISVYN